MNLQSLMNSADTENVPDEFQDLTFITPSAASQLRLNFLKEREVRGSSGMGFDQYLDSPLMEEIGRKTVQTKLCAKGHWRPHEDAKLKELVAQFGPQNWNLIAEKLEGRSGKSCRLRWFNQLDPRINRRAFRDEEEEKLLAAHKMYGNKWAMISKLFPGRTDNAVKNHWHVIMARKLREQTNVYRRRRPSFLQVQHKGFSVEMSNGYSESTISSNNNVDESAASACTDLSLTPSSIKVPYFLTRFSPVQRQKTETVFEAEEKVLAIKKSERQGNNQFHGKDYTVNPAANVDDQSAHSDSNSEVSATLSVANNRSNLYMLGENDNGRKFDNKSMAFIDFLGVGAT